MSYRILSFDGGGLYGEISIRILRRLIEQKPNLLADVDLITGTSVGGIISLGLSAGVDPATIENFFIVDGPKIFSNNWIRQVFGFWDVVPNIVTLN